MKFIAPALILGSAVVFGQNPVQKIVAVGDVTAIGNVTSIDNLTIGSGGQWFVECDTNNPNTSADSVLLSAAGIVQREGDPVSAPAGATLSSFDGLSAPGTGQRAQNLFL